MIGAIAGDIIGSVYEGCAIEITDFPLFSPQSRFTDDTVLSVAVADWILKGGNLIDIFHTYVATYPHAGYGMSFRNWAKEKQRDPYNSWGNGAAMRVSPVGFAFDSVDPVLAKAKETAEVTHNHPEGIKGAQATAAAVFLARTTQDKAKIKHYIQTTFGYNLNRTLSDIRLHYQFDVSCQGSVPESIIAFLESNDYEQAIRNAVSLGGDADTMACIAGGIAQAYYGKIPRPIQEKTLSLLDERLITVVNDFQAQFIQS
jgi:ADP-ribosylglycohydrolase